VVALSVVPVAAGGGVVVVVVVVVLVLPAGAAASVSAFLQAPSKAVDNSRVITSVEVVVGFFIVILPG
jgi:hypothetical protein